ncbi:MAG: hypothetical protein RSE41_04635 [Clostridia bacterium]
MKEKITLRKETLAEVMYCLFLFLALLFTVYEYYITGNVFYQITSCTSTIFVSIYIFVLLYSYLKKKRDSKNTLLEKTSN